MPLISLSNLVMSRGTSSALWITCASPIFSGTLPEGTP